MSKETPLTEVGINHANESIGRWDTRRWGNSNLQNLRDDRAQQRQDAIDAAAIHEFAARPGRVHKASNLDRDVSPWNARPKPQPTAAYWSPLPDLAPKETETWRWSPMNGRLHRRY